MIILGLESSCDETAAALVTADRQILAEALSSQTGEHAAYGGVVPEIAARSHLLHMRALVDNCCARAAVNLDAVGAVAATCGPGLIGGVMVGAMFGKALATALGKPFAAINHLAGHALSPRLVADIPFPYLLLLISGGHCQLLVVHGAGRFQRLGTTIDDAAGEAFDKVAKLLGLGYPGGRYVEQAATRGNAGRFTFPVPMLGRAEPHFSFSGLKTAVRVQVEKIGVPTAQDVSDICAGFQQAMVLALIDRTRRALQLCREHGTAITALVAAGGVAASHTIRTALETLAHEHGVPFHAPPQRLCTDNAAMIAWAAHERFAAGLVPDGGDPHDFAPRPRWPLDPDAEAVGMAPGRAGARA